MVDALGGTAYYLGKAEIEIPLGSGAREMGLRPSVFLDVGSVFGLKDPDVNDYPDGVKIQAVNSDGQALYYDDAGAVTTTVTENPIYSLNLPAFNEQYFGDTPKPRLSVGFGVNWNSPFGPFRIDIAYPILKQEGDDTKTFSFNVGTQF